MNSGNGWTLVRLWEHTGDQLRGRGLHRVTRLRGGEFGERASPVATDRKETYKLVGYKIHAYVLHLIDPWGGPT